MVHADDNGGRGLLMPLVDVLARVPSLSDRAGRNLVIRMMSAELRETLLVEEHQTAIGHLFNLAEVCQRSPERLSALVRIVSRIDHDTYAMVELRRVVAELTPLDLFPTSDRARLFTLLAGVVVPDIADIYRVVAGPTAPSLYGPTTYAEVFRVLETLNAGPDGVPRPLVFVEHIAARVRTELAIELHRWNEAQAVSMGLLAELTAVRDSLRPETAQPLTPAPGSPAYLVLQIRGEGPTGEKYRVSSWRQLGGPTPWSPLHDEDAVGTLDEVKRHVAALVEKVEDDWAQYSPDIRVEFVLDYENLNLDVDQWPWENDADLAQPMGCRYPVVVRSLERMTTRKYHREWRQRWAELTGQLGRATGLARTSTCRASSGTDQGLRELLTQFNTERGLVSLVLSAPPRPENAGRDEVAAGVKAGVPLMVWHRHDCGTPEFSDAVDSVLHGEDDLHLLERVRLARNTAYKEGTRRHVGEALTILYDDPERIVVPSQPGPPREGVAVG